MVVDAVVETFGPFLIPAVLFVAGVVGYVALILLTRYGILPRRGHDDVRDE